MIKDIWSKIAYAWFLVILILVGFFTGNLHVKAATQESYNWTFYNVKTCAPNTPTYSCVQTSNRQPNTGYLPVTENSDFQGYLNEWNVLFSNTSSSWTANKTYSVKVGLGVSSSNVGNGSNQKSLYYYLTSEMRPRFYMYASTDTSMANVTSSNIANFSCSISLNENAVNRIYLNCTFQPTTAIKMFQMKIYYGDNTKLHFEKYGYMTMDNFSSAEDLSGFITNQTEVIQNNFNTTNQNINNINDTLEDDSVDNPDEMIDDFKDLLPSNGTITQLIALPLTLYQKILNSINGTCQSFNLGQLYGTNLIMPCIEVNNYLGNGLWNTIDLMMSGFFILHIGKKMVKAFESFTSMKEGDVIDD